MWNEQPRRKQRGITLARWERAASNGESDPEEIEKEFVLKILFLNTFDSVALGGGAEVVIWEQMSGLMNAGHECVLLSISPKSGLESIGREGVKIWRAGIRNVYWPASKTKHHPVRALTWQVIESYVPTMQGHLRQVLTEEHPDVVSIHNLSGWSPLSW